MRPRTRRLLLILFFGSFISMATGVILYALRDNITHFYTPHELERLAEKPTKAFRLGGMVQQGSVHTDSNGVITFIVGDLSQSQKTVSYQGLLPDLFREGQGVIAEGTLESDGSFKATQILAKHDEKYMPPQLEKSLKEQGGK
jgi:cytochrome c-type biogenesis protein CcmE